MRARNLARPALLGWLIQVLTVLFLPILPALAESPQPVSDQEIRQLIRDLADDCYKVREKASGRLAKIGTAALPAVSAATQSDDCEVSRRAWCLIDQWAADKNVAALLVQLKYRSDPVRAGAADTLGKLGPQALPAISGLTEAAKDTSEIVRCSAQEALKIIHPLPDLKLDLQVDKDEVAIGEENVFTILVTNNGTIPAANVRIEMVIPEQELAVTKVEGPTSYRLEKSRICFETLTLGAQSSMSCEVRVKGLRACKTVPFGVLVTPDNQPQPSVIVERLTGVAAAEESKKEH